MVKKFGNIVQVIVLIQLLKLINKSSLIQFNYNNLGKRNGNQLWSTKAMTYTNNNGNSKYSDCINSVAQTYQQLKKLNIKKLYKVKK